jgi:3'(2'), 5'-bisphosphate nucleotidase
VLSTDAKSPMSLLPAVVGIARLAAAEILAVYHGTKPAEVHFKADNSPVTAADIGASEVIVQELARLSPGVPVLSEEMALAPYEERRQWSEYWLIDPLDGTREFINRSDEFTVNIALIRAGVPVLGVVYAPALRQCWSGVPGLGAWKQTNGEVARPIRTAHLPTPSETGALRVFASRHHGSEALQGMMHRLQQAFSALQWEQLGSSLKICLLAEGRADLYPRLAPTSEWDTAAGQAVLEAAGGRLCRLDLSSLRYNSKENILNPHFIAVGDPDADWRSLLGLA